ncbi:MAG: T9SS type A sorting domain-containing protein [Candidatus Eisenbacteria bacterium]|nr:T9SS type A sorting domain-containing protein [Candidatus Eisenbacteria bacterium]
MKLLPVEGRPPLRPSLPPYIPPEERVPMSTATRTLRVIALCALAASTLAASAGAEAVTERYEFPEPDIETTGEYARVTMEGAWSYGAPGDPVLPIAPARILLPPGHVATRVTVRPGERIELGDGYLVECGQRQYPLSYDGPIELMEPDYAGRGAFPRRLADDPRGGILRGHSIASFALHPVEYDPATGALSYYRSMDVIVTTEPDASAAEAARTMARADDGTARRLAAAVDNPEARVRYHGFEEHSGGSYALEPEPAYDYLIVTTDAWDEYLDDFVDFKVKRGFKVGVFLKSWIAQRYPGVDVQEQIRNFIIDAYRTWGSDYVLLVGDARDENGIPHRGLRAVAVGGSTHGSVFDVGREIGADGGTVGASKGGRETGTGGLSREVDSDIPGDIYYAALDGTWNNDGDGRWGEVGEADLYPDIAVGRLCVNDHGDIGSFTEKISYYEESPVVEDCDEALMVGEYLWPSTYGGDYKDEIRYGSSAHGYTTVGIDDRMNVDTLYERDAGEWDSGTVALLMRNGMNIVNHLGHCNQHYVMKLTPLDISRFTNDGTERSLNFIYTQGCYGGSFDNKQPGGGYTYDCFIELLGAARVGAAACIANSRYGWGEVGGTNGSSQYFDREFFDAMFGEGIYELGYANNDSKADVVWAIDYGANRWCSYQLNLFGDPSMHLWTGEPAELAVERPTLILTGSESVEVTVRGSAGEPLEGARVAVFTDDGLVHDSGRTGPSGVASVRATSPVSGTLHMKVMAHDYLVHEEDVPIVSASEPYLDLADEIVDDDQSGGSSGNGDGALTAGETVEINVTLENLGGGEAVDAEATLSCGSPDVTVLEDRIEFGSIAPHSEEESPTPFLVEIASDAPDGELVEFSLSVTAPGRTDWGHEFALPVSAPVLFHASHYLDDSSGNGNGCPEAGESVTIGLSVSNEGSVQATGVTVTLSTSDQCVAIGGGSLSGTVVHSGETVQLEGECTLSFAPDCPASHLVPVLVEIEADWGYSSSDGIYVLTAGGGLSDDIEGDVSGWYHVAVTEGAVDAWHVESYRSHSGERSWKFGGEGYDSYPSSSDGALMLDPVCVPSGGELRFWDWLQAEEESGTTGWDCALVEASTDFGATWELIEPVGGYTHIKTVSQGNPLPDGTPCWSGSHGWRQEVFDLSGLAGESVIFRFRFASDEAWEQEGWYIDDVEIALEPGAAGSEPENERGLPATFTLRQNAPNPFNPVTTIRYELPVDSDVLVSVYNVAGKLVRTLVDGRVEAGYHRAVWDGTDEKGRSVASGVYMYRLTAGGHRSRRMMVLLK